jgi:hypothetical protein
MTLIVTPPLRRIRRVEDISPSIFLGGSIEMGDARDWQADAIQVLEPYASILYNPRRPDWDSSWEQSASNPEFSGQVHWELDCIELADLVLLHFEPGTKSPITIGEFFLCAGVKPLRTIVSCPEGFWRRGNIEIMCERAGVRFHSSLEAALKTTKRLADAIKLRNLGQRDRLD